MENFKKETRDDSSIYSGHKLWSNVNANCILAHRHMYMFMVKHEIYRNFKKVLFYI